MCEWPYVISEFSARTTVCYALSELRLTEASCVSRVDGPPLNAEARRRTRASHSCTRRRRSGSRRRRRHPSCVPRFAPARSPPASRPRKAHHAPSRRHYGCRRRRRRCGALLRTRRMGGSGTLDERKRGPSRRRSRPVPSASTISGSGGPTGAARFLFLLAGECGLRL